jgi:hypothetical protein
MHPIFQISAERRYRDSNLDACVFSLTHSGVWNSRTAIELSVASLSPRGWEMNSLQFHSAGRPSSIHCSRKLSRSIFTSLLNVEYAMNRTNKRRGSTTRVAVTLCSIKHFSNTILCQILSTQNKSSKRSVIGSPTASSLPARAVWGAPPSIHRSPAMQRAAIQQSAAGAGQVQRGVSLASRGGLHHPPCLNPPRPIALSRPTPSRRPQGQRPIHRELSLSAHDGIPPLPTPPPNRAPSAPVRRAACGPGYVTHPSLPITYK